MYKVTIHIILRRWYMHNIKDAIKLHKETRNFILPECCARENTLNFILNLNYLG